jgi:hypothetical protein
VAAGTQRDHGHAECRRRSGGPLRATRSTNRSAASPALMRSCAGPNERVTK